jgi:predicted Zn-dependent protease
MTPQEVAERALALSRTDGCIVLVDDSTSANLRWAGNTLTTNGVTEGRTLTVLAFDGARLGAVSRTRVTADAIEATVRAAEDAAAESEPEDDAAPLITPAESVSASWEEPAERTSIGVFERFAPALRDAFGAARAAGHSLYGYAEHELTTTYLASSTGLRLRHPQPHGRLELTARTPNGDRSSWTGQGTRDFRDVDIAAHARVLAQRLDWSRRRLELPAGRYETLLPPSAVGDLMVYAYWSMTALDAVEGRTAFRKPGGGTRIGERLAELPLRLYSDPEMSGLQAAPFIAAGASSRRVSAFDNGLPLRSTDWIRDGELTALVQTRHSAGITGQPVTAQVGNLGLEAAGSQASLDEMVATTQRGLLLTCLWYVRMVDPQTLLVTGLTRDGVFLVEGGEVAGAVTNFRFNESPLDVLARATEAGRAEPTLPREFGDYFTRTRMAPLRVPDFNMSSVSPAS